MKKQVYAIQKNGDILAVIEARNRAEAQAKLEEAITRDYMKKNGIRLMRMGEKK
jgi:hypothetical protein